MTTSLKISSQQDLKKFVENPGAFKAAHKKISCLARNLILNRSVRNAYKWIYRSEIKGKDIKEEIGTIDQFTYEHAARIADIKNNPDKYSDITFETAWKFWLEDKKSQFSASYEKRVRQAKGQLQYAIFNQKLKTIDVGVINQAVIMCASMASDETTRRVRNYIFNVLDYFSTMIELPTVDPKQCPIPQCQPKGRRIIQELEISAIREFNSEPVWFIDLLSLALMMRRNIYDVSVMSPDDGQSWLDENDQAPDILKDYLGALVALAQARKTPYLFTGYGSIIKPVAATSITNAFIRFGQKVGRPVKASDFIATWVDKVPSMDEAAQRVEMDLIGGRA